MKAKQMHDYFDPTELNRLCEHEDPEVRRHAKRLKQKHQDEFMNRIEMDMWVKKIGDLAKRKDARA